MDLALYDPDGGYYRAEAARPGRDGDFLTAPGGAPDLRRRARRAWRSLGAPGTRRGDDGAAARPAARIDPRSPPRPRRPGIAWRPSRPVRGRGDRRQPGPPRPPGRRRGGRLARGRGPLRLRPAARRAHRRSVAPRADGVGRGGPDPRPARWPHAGRAGGPAGRRRDAGTRAMEVTPGIRRDPVPDLDAVGQDDGLVARIHDEIARDGPITFARFMDLALYDPDGGYYRADGRSPRSRRRLPDRARRRTRSSAPRSPGPSRTPGTGSAGRTRSCCANTAPEPGRWHSPSSTGWPPSTRTSRRDLRYDPIEVEPRRIEAIAARLAAGRPRGTPSSRARRAADADRRVRSRQRGPRRPPRPPRRQPGRCPAGGPGRVARRRVRRRRDRTHPGGACVASHRGIGPAWLRASAPRSAWRSVHGWRRRRRASSAASCCSSTTATRRPSCTTRSGVATARSAPTSAIASTTTRTSTSAART